MKNLHTYLILGLGLPGHVAVQLNQVWSYNCPKLTYASIDFLCEEVLDTLRKEWTLTISESYDWHGDGEVMWEKVKTMNVDIGAKNKLLAHLKVVCYQDFPYWNFSATMLDGNRITSMSLASDPLALSSVFGQRIHSECRVYNRPEAMNWFLGILTPFLRKQSAI